MDTEEEKLRMPAPISRDLRTIIVRKTAHKDSPDSRASTRKQLMRGNIPVKKMNFVFKNTKKLQEMMRPQTCERPSSQDIRQLKFTQENGRLKVNVSRNTTRGDGDSKEV